MDTPGGAVYGLDTDAWLGHYRRSIQTYPEIEAALRYFKQIFDLAPVPYVVTDLHFVIGDANNAAQRLLNRPITGLRGKPLSVFVAQAEQMIFRAIAGEITSAGRLVRPLCISPRGQPDVDTVFSAMRIGGAAQHDASILWVFQDALVSGESDLL